MVYILNANRQQHFLIWRYGLNMKLPASLILLIGRRIFDGADAEQLAVRFAVSLDTINQTWLESRECLSRHFAEQEETDYRLLTDNDLKGRAAPLPTVLQLVRRPNAGHRHERVC
jgi:hypothetical protein